MNLLEDILSPLRDYKAKTPHHVLKDFLESNIYTDFLNEISLRIEQMRDLNEECNSKEYLETRGGIKAIRLTAAIFHDLYANALEDQTRADQSTDEEDE